MIKAISIYLMVIAICFFCCVANAQKGFRVEISVGPTLADSKELFSYTLQGHVCYLWSLSDVVNLGASTGVVTFLGEGSNGDGSKGWFSSIPDVFMPLAVASNFNISKSIYAGIDLGYALNANYIGDNDGGFFNDSNGGFYMRPSMAYRLKEKLALVLSYTSIAEDNYNSAALNIGLNFRF
ncbi:outer membrane beta-barrel protein [Tamlana fucoidanivorans]|uniref:Porin family protein n=1 Tax=Allotamlana fucoidanivorans TaxID=2583814 RepID=A0A5C4SLA2_9FLAO|nr:outer membrane beta-barrel protein [Tamlana fucoidanivorans]TNJ44676.1 porin family protein [Tamlana fucoidanivorans]